MVQRAPQHPGVSALGRGLSGEVDGVRLAVAGVARVPVGALGQRAGLASGGADDVEDDAGDGGDNEGDDGEEDEGEEDHWSVPFGVGSAVVLEPAGEPGAQDEGGDQGPEGEHLGDRGGGGGQQQDRDAEREARDPAGEAGAEDEGCIMVHDVAVEVVGAHGSVPFVPLRWLNYMNEHGGHTSSVAAVLT
nr:MAG TPA: hypothetical protein [Caudoviricetes sp.]